MATIDGSKDEGAFDAQEAAPSGGRWIRAASAAAILGGIAIAVLPRALPASAESVERLTRHGVEAPLLCGLGLVLAAIAGLAQRLRTARSDVGPIVEPAPSPRLAEDPWAREVTSELSRLRGGVHDLRVDFVYVKDALARLQQSSAQADSGAGRDTEAAIFRLAASLDQLGGRIEHEIASQRAWLVDALERHPQPTSHGVEPRPRFADPYNQGFEGVGHEVHLEEGYFASEDDLHVEVALDDDAEWHAGLGVLDDIEEPRAPIANGKTSPSGRPLPSGGFLDELESGAADIEGKMAQLRHLLSDPGVQRALESRTR